MAYNAQFDLRGKRIQDTYTQVLQYDSSSGVAYTGQGGSLNLSSSFATTASFTSTAAFANNATSASYAPASPTISASYAAQADHATLAAGLDVSAYGASSSLYGPFLSGEVSIDGINTLRALYLDQYSVVKASTMTNNDLGFATGLTASVQGQLDNLRTGSGVLNAVSASYSQWANESSRSLTTNGLIIEIPAPDITARTGTPDVIYPTNLIQTAVTVGESNPHVSGKNTISGSALFGGGWNGIIYRINTPDGDLQNITSASCIAESGTGPRNISAGVYCSTVDAMFYIVGGTYPTTVSTASIIKVDALTLSQSLFHDGIDNGNPSGYGFGLPPMTCDDNYIYVVTAADTPCDIMKIDVNTGALIQSKSWVGAGGAHACQISDDKSFFLATTGGGSICRVNTSDFSVISSSLGIGSITDDFAIMGDYAFPVPEGDIQMCKVNVNTLSSSTFPAYLNSYGSFTDGVHLYLGQAGGGRVWVYPYGNINLGPLVYSVPGTPNEMWFTQEGKIVTTGWTTTNIYSSIIPLVEVGINKSPNTTLDVAGTIQSPWIKATSQLEGVTIKFSGSLSNTASNFSVSQTNVRIGQYTGSNPIGSSGIRVAYISASVVTASLGFFGTASNAISASWAPGAGGGTTLVTASTYDITSSWAVNVVNGANQVSVSWASSSMRLSNASASIGTNGRAGFGKTAASSFIEIQGDGNDAWITAYGSGSTSQLITSEDGIGGAYVQVNDAGTNYFAVMTAKDLTASLDLSSALTSSRIFLNSKNDSYFLNEGNVGIGTDTPTSKLHIIGEITSSALRVPYTSNGSGITVGGIDIQTNDNTNGSIGWNSVSTDGGTSWVKPTTGPSGLIHVSAPSLFVQMSPSDTSGSSAITTTQVRVNGLDNTVALGGSIGTGFSYGNPVMLVSGSNRVTVSGSISASLGFTGSLFGTSSYTQTSSIANTASYVAITVQGNGSSLDQYIPFVSNSGSVDKLFVDNTGDFRFNPVDNRLTVTHISASCITGSAQAGYVAFLGTASWAQNVNSASIAETAKTASFLNGLATGSAGAGYASFFGTASWALNTVNGGSGGNAGTQSSVDISMKDMQFPFTAAFAGITPALLNGASFDNNVFSRNGNGSVNGLVFWYLTFRNENIAGGNEVGNALTASIAFHQMRAPVNYNPAGGLTHSFQYYAVGTVDGAYSAIEGEVPGANNKVYWNVDLFALTSSTAANSNFFSAPKLCGTNVVTQSFSGAIHESGSMETVTSMFNDAYLSNDCMFFINVKRINSDSSSIYDPGVPVGDRTDYTGSVAMVSSRVSYNTM